MKLLKGNCEALSQRNAKNIADREEAVDNRSISPAKRARCSTNESPFAVALNRRPWRTFFERERASYSISGRRAGIGSLR